MAKTVVKAASPAKVLQWKVSVLAYGDHAHNKPSEHRYPAVHLCGFDGPCGHGELASLMFDPVSVDALCDALKKAAAEALRDPQAEVDFEVLLQRTEPDE